MAMLEQNSYYDNESMEEDERPEEITKEDETFKELERNKNKFNFFSYIVSDIPINPSHEEWRNKSSDGGSKGRAAKAKNKNINKVCRLLISERSDTNPNESLPPSLPGLRILQVTHRAWIDTSGGRFWIRQPL